MDWIVSAATLVSMLLVAKRMWQGWAVGLANQALWLGLIFSRDDMYGLLPLAAALTGIYSWALWKWRIPKPVETQAVRDDRPTANVIRVATDDGGERCFREVPAVITEHDPATNEPRKLQVIGDDVAKFGDRAVLINVLVPEECFTTL